jgi:NADP-dependent 3-hydroxy acid dehydrogenase YdfG
VNITGNTIFIPGSTSGIGLALAAALQARGNTVIVGGRRAAALERVAAEHPGLGTVQIDTTDTGSIASAAKRVLDRHPDLNVLVTMAGIMRVEDWRQPGAFLDSAEQVITTNLLGPKTSTSVPTAQSWLPRCCRRNCGSSPGPSHGQTSRRCWCTPSTTSSRASSRSSRRCSSSARARATPPTNLT